MNDNPLSYDCTNCTIIVDPYSSGAMLAEALRARSARCVAVESGRSLPTSMKSRFDSSGFEEVIQHRADFGMTFAAVKGHQPTHVVAGFESGVELAERLAAALALPSNGPQLGEARRNKFLMAEAVQQRGLRAPITYQSDDVDGILEWIRGTLDWPVVLKPPKSVASDNVFCCRSEDEVRQSANSILSGTNVLGRKNPTVLVQEFLDGIEYVVDMVCCQEAKKTTAIWQYHRPPETRDSIGYDAMTLLPYRGERQEALRSYASQVLDALAIRFGPAHCELMWVSGEPVLVEVGARLSAGNNAVLSRVCGGICQLDETVEAILAPDRFLASCDDQPHLTRLAANVFLTSHRTGRLARVRGLEQIHRLPTLHSFSVSSQPGDMIGRVAGLVTLIDDDIQAIQRDMGVLRGLVRDGMFEVHPVFPERI